ncbi:MAG: hypothetical protein IT343_16595 [Candidatus Melainabacteria bacterium]|nr:hypothetical protein [Candidatus Melainabacteria bacterium]
MAATHTTRMRFIAITCLLVLVLSASAFGAEKAQSNWNAAKGWNGLVVGKSTLNQARTRLGKLFNTEMVAGTKCYNFKKAKVNVFVDEKTKVITKIWVSGDLKDPAVPKTVNEAMKMFGELGNKGPDGSGGNIYEKPGLSLLSDPKETQGGIAWMEFSKVK